jgi:ribosomal protein S18 acetylase RimI-like enzyme
VSTIRSATIQDMPGAYRVCLATGDSGRDATGLYRNPDLLGHVYVGPYIVGEPDLALVVADEHGVAGYCLGALDSRLFEAWKEADWWPELRRQHPLRAGESLDAEVIRLIHSPHLAPEQLVAEYPSHLHIDLLERARRHGHGRALIERLLERLSARGSAGVHLNVAADNPNAIAFYRHLGFVDLQPTEESLYMGRRLVS